MIRMLVALLLTLSTSLAAAAELNVPLISQTYNACGPASMAQVIRYFGGQISQQDISRLTRQSDRSYMSAQQLLDYAPVAGMNARMFSGGTLEMAEQLTARGFPLIVLQHITWNRQTVPHWRVVSGVDRARGGVYLVDPLQGRLWMPAETFERSWKPTRGQFALMYPPELELNLALVLAGGR